MDICRLPIFIYLVALGSMKIFKILREDYQNRRDGFDDLSIEICAGLHNLYIKRKLN